MELLSNRATPFLEYASNPKSYSRIQASLGEDTYDKVTNPNGAILMAVSENKLCNDLMIQRIQQYPTLGTGVMNYSSGSGSHHLKTVMADCLSDIVFNFNSIDKPIERVKLDDLIICAGCTQILHRLSILLFEHGDCILLPAPYYPSFDRDFGAVGGVHKIPIAPSDFIRYELTQVELDKAYVLAMERGQPPKAMLLTNPHNPLGKSVFPGRAVPSSDMVS